MMRCSHSCRTLWGMSTTGCLCGGKSHRRRLWPSSNSSSSSSFRGKRTCGAYLLCLVSLVNLYLLGVNLSWPDCRLAGQHHMAHPAQQQQQQPQQPPMLPQHGHMAAEQQQQQQQQQHHHVLQAPAQHMMQQEPALPKDLGAAPSGHGNAAGPVDMHMGGHGGAPMAPSMSVDIDHMDMDAVESSANSIVPSIAMQVGC